MEKCTQEVTPDTAPSVLKNQLLEAARDPLAAWLDEKVYTMRLSIYSKKPSKHSGNFHAQLLLASQLNAYIKLAVMS